MSIGSRTTYLKFAVVGLTGAGTTSLIRTVQEINELENWGRLSIGDFMKTQPQVRLGLLPKAQDQWEIVLADKLGILILLDSARPDNFVEVKATIQAVRRLCSKPIIILANKQDHSAALDSAQIRANLGLSSDIPVIPCSAKDKTSTTKVLKWLTEWAYEKKA